MTLTIKKLEKKHEVFEKARLQLWKTRDNFNKKLEKYNFDITFVSFYGDSWTFIFEFENKRNILFTTPFFACFIDFLNEISMEKIFEYWEKNTDEKITDDKHLEKLEKSIEEFIKEREKN